MIYLSMRNTRNVAFSMVAILILLIPVLHAVPYLVVADNPLWIDVGGPYYGLVGEPIQFYLDIQGGMLPYNKYWDFGDGNTSTLRYPTHVYDEVGTFAVSITVTDGNGDSMTRYANAHVYDELIVDAGGPYSGYEGNTIEFSAHANGGIIPYIYSWDLDNDWEFDDAEGITASNMWESAGTYTIALQVKDDIGNTNIDITQVTIGIENTKPNKPSKPEGGINGEKNKEYTYSTMSTDPQDDQVYYLWDWGDDTDSGWLGPFDSGVTVEATHSWGEKGSYDIKVMAKDTGGLLSDWSDPLPISIPKNQCISSLISDIWEIIINRFPVLERFILFLPIFN